METARNTKYGGSTGVESACGPNWELKVAKEKDGLWTYRLSSAEKAWENMERAVWVSSERTDNIIAEQGRRQEEYFIAILKDQIKVNCKKELFTYKFTALIDSFWKTLHDCGCI
jgi:hypothetical protein